jgi:hypothetical protein
MNEEIFMFYGDGKTSIHSNHNYGQIIKYSTLYRCNVDNPIRKLEKSHTSGFLSFGAQYQNSYDIKSVKTEGGFVTQITVYSPSINVTPSVRKFDVFQVNDGTRCLPNVRMLPHHVDQWPCQFYCLENSDSNSDGDVNLVISPINCSLLTLQLEPGMRISAIGDYKCAFINIDNPLHILFPREE